MILAFSVNLLFPQPTPAAIQKVAAPWSRISLLQIRVKPNMACITTSQDILAPNYSVTPYPIQ
jgi:hypothetical protein